MARPGVKEGRIRKSKDGRKKMRRANGRSWFEGISVQGHCLGLQARNWRLPPAAAGYPYALDAANAVIKAGKMRTTSRPPKGALVWWSTGGYPGHIAHVVGVRRNACRGNVGSIIKKVKLSYFDANFRRLGWCMPGDVPTFK